MACKTGPSGKTTVALALMLVVLTSCTYNPFTTHNHLTGTATGTAIGAGAGVGAAALIGQTTKPGPLLAGGLIGAALGYYISSLTFDAAGVTHNGGQVFTLGDYASIEIPTDNLFDTNSAEFVDNAGPILDSAVAVLNRYPDNNIMVSGNTSGFGAPPFEQKLSQARAQQVAAYLWAHGISNFKYQSNCRRKLTYTGYGNYFPVANDIHNDSIRQNSRIQITAYPSKDQLEIDKRHQYFNNVGGLNDDDNNSSQSSSSKDDDDVWGNYNKRVNASQTTEGDSVEKQGGDTEYKDESPR